MRRNGLACVSKILHIVSYGLAAGERASRDVNNSVCTAQEVSELVG